MSAELVTTLKCQSTPVDVEIYELMQQRISLLEGIARGEMAFFRDSVWSIGRQLAIACVLAHHACQSME